jgi:SNF2 family DNA or RNA helicase
MRFLPRTYQREAMNRIEKYEYQLIALRMGAGKTVITLSVLRDSLRLKKSINKVLIVAPKRVAELVWHTEAQKWDHTADLKITRVLGSEKDRLAALLNPAEIYVINRENFSWLVDKELEQKGFWSFDCVVVDENWGFKNHKSKNWLHLKKIRQDIRRLYLLTGTPAPNSLLELWPQISIMDFGKRLGPRFGQFRDKWFTPDKRSGHIVYTWKPKLETPKWVYEQVQDVMFSVDHDLDLPDRLDNVVYVDIDRKRYDQMAEDMVSGELNAASAGILAGKLAQISNGACYDDDKRVHVIHDKKLEALAETVEQGEPVLCFTTFRHDQTRILERFPEACVFDGEESLGRWKRGEVALLLMHPASGGHGVDGLQLGGRVAVWFGLPFSLDLYEQANARLHRPGQTKGVVIHHLVGIGTIDERIIEALQNKSDMQQALLEAVEIYRSAKVSA